MCPQVFLFVYYGLILQAAQEGSLVRNHLQGLLKTSHQWATQREVRDLERGRAGPGPRHPPWAHSDSHLYTLGEEPWDAQVSCSKLLEAFVDLSAWSCPYL